MQDLRENKRICSYRDCESILEGRSDKIFCCDQCRNRARRDLLKTEKWNAPLFYHKISDILQHNHKLLRQLYLQKGDSIIVTSFLLRDSGFNFEFHTRILQTSAHIYRFCFDYGWLELESGKILIVRNEKMLGI